MIAGTLLLVGGRRFWDCGINWAEPLLLASKTMMTMEASSRSRLPAEIAVRGDTDGELTQRTHAEAPHPYRTPFARDVARILHARACKMRATSRANGVR